jgi:branched-chain amino acid transport system ATP-binding protein
MIMKINKVAKRFGGIRALDDCSLDIAEGKIVAVIGPNGSGKSTLFNIISGMIKADKGGILFEGAEISEMEDFERARMGIARTFQEVRLFKNLTIREHLEIALSKKDESFFGGLFGSVDSEEYEKELRAVLEIVGLDKPLNSYASELSYGQRKLLDLAVAIAKPHSLLMLDEPVAGINPALREDIKRILRNLNKNHKKTILIIEHDMNFVMDLADYIYVLDYGKLIAEGKPREIQGNKKVLGAYLGG